MLEPEPDEEDSEDEPEGRGAVPAVPVEKLLPPPEPPPWLNEFASFEEAEPPLSPLPSMPRSVLASFTASALRSRTTCMLPGTALGASSCASRRRAEARREAFEARSRIELVRGSADTLTFSVASVLPIEPGSSSLPSWLAMSIALAFLSGTTTTWVPAALSTPAMICAMRRTLSA